MNVDELRVCHADAESWNMFIWDRDEDATYAEQVEAFDAHLSTGIALSIAELT